MNRKLFRYIGFEDFINLTINNKDRFVRPSSWDDKYEGYLFSHMETPEDVRQIVSEMYHKLCPRNYYAIPDNYFRMWHSKWFICLMLVKTARNRCYVEMLFKWKQSDQNTDKGR